MHEGAHEQVALKMGEDLERSLPLSHTNARMHARTGVARAHAQVALKMAEDLVRSLPRDSLGLIDVHSRAMLAGHFPATYRPPASA